MQGLDWSLAIILLAVGMITVDLLQHKDLRSPLELDLAIYRLIERDEASMKRLP